jgi:glutamyl-tRNA reductase
VQDTFFAFGLNHETASVATSEAFALFEEAQRRVHTAFRAGQPAPDADGPELVLVSTCNRTEAYLYGTGADVERLKALLACEARRAWPEEEAFLRSDEAAVEHVLEVTAGLRSLVPGDVQILAQVKDAYRRAVEADAVDMVGHRLMHTAFRAAKRVQSETSLSSGAASVSTAAVALAEDFFRKRLPAGWTDRRALLVGAGKMGRLALEALAGRPEGTLASVAVTNRSPERAEDAARAFGADVVPWEARHAAAARADLVVVATGAEAPVLHARELPDRPTAADAAALVVDIARPRNADSAIAERPGYALRDMDALQEWVREAQSARRAALPQAEAICDEMKREFVSWVFHQEALQPAIEAIRSTFENIRRQEIERHAHRFSDADAESLERLTQSILQKLLAVPIVRLKGLGGESMDFSRGIRLLRTLFSRPGCEDAAARPVEERAEEEAPASTREERPVAAPARCPYETHQPRVGVAVARDAQQLAEALRRPSLLPAPGRPEPSPAPVVRARAVQSFEDDAGRPGRPPPQPITRRAATGRPARRWCWARAAAGSRSGRRAA